MRVLRPHLQTLRPNQLLPETQRLTPGASSGFGEKLTLGSVCISVSCFALISRVSLLGEAACPGINLREATSPREEEERVLGVRTLRSEPSRADFLHLQKREELRFGDSLALLDCYGQEVYAQ